MDDLNIYVKRARRHGACEDDLRVVANCGTIEEAKRHKDAPLWVYWYAKHVLKERWPEMEDVIRRSAYWAVWYAFNVIHGRWPEAEDVIGRKAEAAYVYARYVIQARWPEEAL